VLGKVRRVFGGRLVMAVVGAAPIAPALIEFFDACGVLLLEGYGMTETCSTATLNPATAPRAGTVGPPLPESEVRIAADQEILLRGPHIFRGYFGDDEATTEVLDDDGWLHSGDLGALTAEGYLKITGRKKDLIITSNGKNITPANIESLLNGTRWISEAVVYGDNRPYLVALVTLDHEKAAKLADHLGISSNIATMALDDRVHSALQADVEEVNQHFARIEQIKRFRILDRDLTEAGGEMTPTLKVKRNVVYGKYAEFFADIYKEPGR
jgi:long-chain acyl-CoA synthetase